MMLNQSHQRYLSREQCDAIVDRVHRASSGIGEASITIESGENGESRWARNYVSLATVRLNQSLQIFRRVTPGAMGSAQTNQFDDASVAAAVQSAEREARRMLPSFQVAAEEAGSERPELEGYVIPVVWSDRSASMHPKERSEIVQQLVQPAEAAGMLSAGYASVRSASSARAFPGESMKYLTYTAAQCSMTVRDPGGQASGWAGVSSYDWARIDTEQLAQRALEKCLASRNPVAVEPGRYTVILEPQAVHELLKFVVEWLPQRFAAERGYGPFSAGTKEHPYESKIGSKIADEQITISYDPLDPNLAIPTFDGVRPVTWVERGILKVLGYDRNIYALPFFNEDDSRNGSGAYRVAEGTATIEEMIASTPRGLLVTRFADVVKLERKSLLSTGFTRDGLWLIERGKISKSVKNFRFTESPLFVLNNIEQVGSPAIPVFSPDMPAVVPPIKARDFSFTSLIDAI